MSKQKINSVIDVRDLMSSFNIPQYQIEDTYRGIIRHLTRMELLMKPNASGYDNFNAFVDYINDGILPNLNHNVTIYCYVECDSHAYNHFILSYTSERFDEIGYIIDEYNNKLNDFNSGDLDEVEMFGHTLKKFDHVISVKLITVKTAHTVFI